MVNFETQCSMKCVCKEWDHSLRSLDPKQNCIDAYDHVLNVIRSSKKKYTFRQQLYLVSKYGSKTLIEMYLRRSRKLPYGKFHVRRDEHDVLIESTFKSGHVHLVDWAFRQCRTSFEKITPGSSQYQLYRKSLIYGNETLSTKYFVEYTNLHPNYKTQFLQDYRDALKRKMFRCALTIAERSIELLSGTKLFQKHKTWCLGISDRPKMIEKWKFLLNKLKDKHF